MRTIFRTRQPAGQAIRVALHTDNPTTGTIFRRLDHNPLTLPAFIRPVVRNLEKRLTVVIATRNRRDGLLATLDKLCALPDKPALIVVDNHSDDGTVSAIRYGVPGVRLVRQHSNRAAAARNVGVRLARTPYIAFADDDSWWAPGALECAADLLDAYPRLGLVAARVLVGEEEQLDPACEQLAASPLRATMPLPGPRVLGFVACGAVVRRSAFMQVGGFHPRFGVGGEEPLLAMDLASAGWQLAYVSDLVAHRQLSQERDPAEQRRVLTRNALWTAWLRRPLRTAIGQTARAAWASRVEPDLRAGLFNALKGLPALLPARRCVSPELERDLRMVER